MVFFILGRDQASTCLNLLELDLNSHLGELGEPVALQSLLLTICIVNEHHLLLLHHHVTVFFILGRDLASTCLNLLELDLNSHLGKLG